MLTPPVNANPVSPMASKNISFLALGDSYTIGQGVGETERFPAQTSMLIKPLGLNVVKLQYIATTGWTTFSLKAAIESEKPATNFDIVTLLIGVNDQYQHLDTTGYKTRFEELLKMAIIHAGNRPANVFVLSIPDYSATPFVSATDKQRVSKEIDEFNRINRNITLHYKIAYIDITPSTRQASSDLSLVAGDGLHPSGKEYKKWADLLAPLINDLPR